MAATGTKKFQLSVTALAVAAAATLTPMVVPAVTHAAPLPSAPLPAAPVPGAAPQLIWGFDEVPAALVPAPSPAPAPIPGNNKPAPAAAAPAAAAPAAAAAVGGNAVVGSAVGAAPTPAQLLQYLVQGIATGVQGIARGATVIVGTTAYVAIAFTGGIITTVGNFLPGPVGNFLVGVGTSVNNVANTVAQALRVGPYATSA